MSTWRDKFRPIIAAVIEEHGVGDMPLLREKLRQAYPCGERAYWPYKVWLDEFRLQVGLRKAGKRRTVKKPDTEQPELF